MIPEFSTSLHVEHFHPQEAVVERKWTLIVLWMLVAATWSGCTTIYKFNPLSRSHGLPQQYEQDDE